VRRIVGLLMAVLLVCIGTALAIRVTMPTPTGYQAYGRIRLGMTRAEVEAVIGMPPGWYDSKHREGLPPSMEPFGHTVKESGLSYKEVDDLSTRVTEETWFWEDYWIWVYYDETEHAVRTELIEVLDDKYPRNPPLNPIDRLRKWLGI
jgi:hypothetical protein